MNRPRIRRRAATFVEIMVAAGLLILILAGAWYFFVVARRSSDQVYQYASVLQAATSIGARLQIDLSAAYVPSGDILNSNLFEIGPENRKLGFTRTPPADNVENSRSTGSGRRWIEYATEPGPGTGANQTYVLKRIFGDRTSTWAGTVCKDIKFSIERAGGRNFLVAELLIQDEKTAERPDDSNRRPFALRVVRRLRDPANFAGVEGHLNEFPADLLGPLPATSDTAEEVPLGADPNPPPPNPENVGLEL